MASVVSKALGFQSVSVLIKALSHLAVMVVLGRHLTAAEFGLVASAQLFIMLLQTISEAGVSSVLIQQKELSHGMQTAALMVSFFVGLIFFVCVWWLAPVIEGYFETSGLVELIRILSFGFILIGVSSVSESLMQRKMQFDVLLKVNFFSYILAYTPVAVILAMSGYGAKAVVIASVVQLFVKSVALVFYKRITFFARPNVSDFQVVTSFGGGVVLIRIANYLFKNIDKLLIGKLLGQDALGLYHLATQLILLPLQYLGDIVASVFFPVLSRFNSDRDKFVDVFIKSSLTMLLILGAAVILLLGYPELLVSVLYGPNWPSLAGLVVILAPILFIRGLGRIVDVANRAIGKVYQVALIKSVMTCIMGISVYFAAQDNDLHNVSIAVIAVSVLAWFSLAKFTSVSGRFSLILYWKGIFKVAVFVVGFIGLMFLLIPFFGNHSMTVQVFVGLGVTLSLYLGAVYKLYFSEIKQLLTYKL